MSNEVMKSNENNIEFVDVVLPFSKEELSLYMDNLDKYAFNVNFKESLDRLNGDTHKLLIYISNCNLKYVYIKNYNLKEGKSEDFEKFLISYIEFNQELNINILSEYWVATVFENMKMNNEIVEKFIERFRIKYSNYVEEIKDFYYSLTKALFNVINPTVKELEKEIKDSDSNSLKLCGYNIVSISSATQFYKYLSKLKRYKMYLYDEFVNPVLNGASLSFYFIQRPTPFQILYLHNQFILHPEETKEIMKKIVYKKES